VVGLELGLLRLCILCMFIESGGGYREVDVGDVTYILGLSADSSRSGGNCDTMKGKNSSDQLPRDRRAINTDSFQGNACRQRPTTDPRHRRVFLLCAAPQTAGPTPACFHRALR
jgi:hypothetical protein